MINKLFTEISSKAVVLILTTALLFSTMFTSIRVFVESAIISKQYVLIIGTLIGWTLMLLNKKTSFLFDRLSMILCIFIGYLILLGLLSDMIPIQVLLLTSFLGGYFFFKSYNIDKNHISVIIVMICLIQACYGILQYTGICYVQGGTFKILGSFDNPSGFAACLVVGYPFCFSLISTKFKRIGTTSAIIIICSIALSESRAGIISIVLTSGIYMYLRLKSLKSKYIYIITLSALILLLGITLFFYKENSAIGRLLIWRNSLEMIHNKPIFGHGANSFLSEYMEFQADYFTKNPDSKFTLLADNVFHPFNEYLSLTIEYGLVGLLILSGVLIVAFSSEKVNIPLLAIISIVIFACFSYPLRYSFVLTILAYCLSAIKNGKQYHVNFNIRSRLTLLIAVCIGTFFLAKDILFEYKWGILVKSTYLNKYDGLENYNILYEKWNGDAFFLYNYGSFLNHIGNYQMSNNIITKCMKYFNDYNVQILIAENHTNLGNFNEAEKHYILASKMIPNRFSPLSELLRLYASQGETDKAIKTAQIIMNKQIKIHSTEINIIIKDALDYIDNLNIELCKDKAIQSTSNTIFILEFNTYHKNKWSVIPSYQKTHFPF